MDLLGLCDYDPYDPYFDYDCWVLAQEVAKLTGLPLEDMGKSSYYWLLRAYEELSREPSPMPMGGYSFESLMFKFYRLLVDYTPHGRLTQMGLSGLCGYLEDEGISSGPSDLNKNLWGEVLIQEYGDLIVAAANASSNPLITPELLAAIVRTQGGPNYPLLGPGEKIMIHFHLCRGCCSVGITQVDACQAQRLQELNLVSGPSSEKELALLLATDPAANLAYMVAMLEYSDHLLLEYYRLHGLGFPPDEYRLALMEVVQNSKMEWWKKRAESIEDIDDFFSDLQESNPNVGKVLPWLEWSEAQLEN